MTLPTRINNRLKILATATTIALAAPAWTGFGDPAAETPETGLRVWSPRLPFSIAAWRARVGPVHEALRGFVSGAPVQEEAAHPPENALPGTAASGGDDANATANVASGVPDALPPAPVAARTAVAGADLQKLLGQESEIYAQALAAYKAGDFRSGDAASAELTSAAAEAAAQWAGLRLHPKDAGFRRLAGFLATHSDWPAADWTRKRIEEALYAEHQPDHIVLGWFGDATPLTGHGKFLLARALARRGDFDAAALIARDGWRRDDLGPGFETQYFKELGEFLSPQDHKYRADRLLYHGKNALALSAAERAGPEVVLLARARASGGEKAFASVPATLQSDAGLFYSRIRTLNNARKFTEAATLLRKAPRDPESVIEGDLWWMERRQTARKVLDLGDADTAYVLCAQHAAQSTSNKVEAEFMAGWIALRFLDDPARAARHFAALDHIAETPLQKSRALYWRGRAAEAFRTSDMEAQTQNFMAAAAAYTTTFYGQLAAAKIYAGQSDSLAPSPLRAPPEAAPEAERHEAIKVVELLLAGGDKDLATPLALDAAKSLAEPRQVAALGAVIERQRDAKLSLVFGKSASYRGVALDQVAFPNYGVPDFTPLPGSAPRSIVYAIARQESAFDPKALSSAGAMGLMQMIAATARHTAFQHGVTFDISRMLNEPAFNAQLGAAHLGALLGEYKGAYLLSFAAYNAGGGRVKQWIDAYGDPRKSGVDPVDWVERIPIAETRNYVQRVMENLIVYRARFGEFDTRSPHQEMARAGEFP
jgi:soluble lytic murein transglycosylase